MLLLTGILEYDTLLIEPYWLTPTGNWSLVEVNHLSVLFLFVSIYRILLLELLDVDRLDVFERELFCIIPMCFAYTIIDRSVIL